MKRLFIIEGVHVGDGAATLDLHFECGRKHEYNVNDTEIRPFEILSYTITTTDITTARTATIALYSKNQDRLLYTYDVTPNLDNNVIYLKAYGIVEDGATAGTTALTGSTFGFKCTGECYIRYILSGTVDNTDTMTIRLVYVAEEKMNIKVIAGDWTESFHQELGVFE